MSLLTEELKSWVGREAHYPAREELGRASIRYFALAMGDGNPLYVDDAYAREAGYPSVIAPPTLVCETCQYAHQPPNAEGYIGHEWHLPVANCRLIRAGNEYEFVRPVLPADRIAALYAALADFESVKTMRDFTDLVATRGGAEVLGRPECGVLAPGKRADFAIWDMTGIESAGAWDPVAALVFCGPFTPRDLDFAADQPVVMTEKDAVKLRRAARPNWWVLPVTARLAPAFATWLLARAQKWQKGSE